MAARPTCEETDMSIPTHDRQILSAAQPVHHTDSDADFPILIVQAHSDQTTTSSLAARALAERGFEFVSADGTEDGGLAVRNHPELACVLIGPDHEHLDSAVSLIELI